MSEIFSNFKFFFFFFFFKYGTNSILSNVGAVMEVHPRNPNPNPDPNPNPRVNFRDSAKLFNSTVARVL